MLTDSVNAASFFGGVGTALILGILLANRTGASLRLATRTDAPDGRVVAELEKAHGLALAGPLKLSHVPIDGTRALTVGPGDVLMTTSWWTTRAVLDSTLPRDQVVYLLQEDERMFYPWGDDRLLCQETLAEPDLAVVVDTRRLLDHLTTSGAITVTDATSFEPAFPGIEPAPRESTARRQLSSTPGPRTPGTSSGAGVWPCRGRSRSGCWTLSVWDFHFVGRSTPELTLPGEVAPQVHEGLPWAAYQDLVSRMDAALVLMDTPHPSYPPYDLAAAGAAVLTNTHGSKTDLSDISANIITAPSSMDGLAEGLAQLAALGQDDDQRARNRADDGIVRSWDVALADVVGSLVARYAPVLGGSSDVH